MTSWTGSLRQVGVRLGLYAGLRPKSDRVSSFAISVTDARRMPESESELARMFLDHNGRLAHKWMHYFRAYEQNFGQHRHGFSCGDGIVHPLRMLELGVSHGGSLQLWRQYFGPEAVIFGIDIDDRCKTVDDHDLQVRIGSQSDRTFLESVVAEMGGVDIVLDDCSHVGKETMAAFSTLFPLLSDGGWYVVEDLHTAYWPSFGPRRENFVEVTKDIIDGMHAWYRRGLSKRGAFAKTQVAAVHVYASMVFIEKRRTGRPVHLEVGEPSFSMDDSQSQPSS